MKINTLPVEIQNRVFTLQIEQGNTPNGDLDLIDKKCEGNFDWHRSPEDYEFWDNVNDGLFSGFHIKYGYDYPDPRLKMQEKLNGVITDIIRDCPFTMSEHNWDSLRDIMSVHLQKMLGK